MALTSLRWTGMAVLALLAGAAAAEPASSPAPELTTSAAAGVAPVIEPTSLRLQGEVLYTTAGKPVTLFHFFATAADCGRAAAQLQLVAPPAHGEVRFTEGAEPPVAGGAPLWRAPDPRARCADQLVATRDAVYQPAAGYVGPDSLTVEFDAGGERFDDVVEVNVEKLGGPQPNWERERRTPAARNPPPAS